MPAPRDTHAEWRDGPGSDPYPTPSHPRSEARFRRLLPLLLCSLAGVVAAQPKLIAIANFGEHPALRAGIDGFKSEIKRERLVEGRDVAYDDQHINFDRTLIPQLLTNAQSKRPALILAVTTPVAQSSIRVVTDKSIPIVSCRWSTRS